MKLYPFSETGWLDVWSHVGSGLLTLLNLLDAHFTSRIVHHPAEELNPLWQPYLASHSMWQFIIFKSLFVMFGIAWVLLLRRSHARLVLAFMIGYYLNTVVIQFVHLH
jgi:hypothetical protein